MERISRREFIKGFFLSSLSLALGNLIYELGEKNTSWLNSPETWEFFTNKNLPRNLHGAHAATPFLYLCDNQEIESHLESIKDIRSVTVFVDDKYETSLGVYEQGILDRLQNFSNILERKGLGLSVVLFDCYTTRKTWNPFYGSHDATSPYAVFGIREFYRSQKLREFFKKRILRITKRLKGFKNLFSVSIANEPIPPDNNPYSQEYINWFNQMIQIVGENLLDKPILPGVANPFLIPDEIKGLSANTTHVYIYDISSISNTIRYVYQGSLPLFVQEIGVPEYIFGRSLPFESDFLMSRLIHYLFQKTAVADVNNRKIELGISSLTFWKKDSYFDGFNFDYYNYPETYKIVKALNFISDNLKLKE